MLVAGVVFGALMPLSKDGLAQTIDMSGFVSSINLATIQSSARLMIEGDGASDPDQMCANNAAGDECRIRSGLPPRGASNVSTLANPALLRFTPNLATRQRNLAGFIAKTRAQSPENADQMEQMFASTDIFAAFAQGLAPTGLKIDNVADCYAAYWISAWEAANGITGSQTSRAQAQAVKAQVSRALLSTPDFTKSTPAQKQELAEAMLIQTALISASAEAAANDPAQMEAVGVAVRQGAKAMGLDLDAMTLSETGFKPVS